MLFFVKISLRRFVQRSVATILLLVPPLSVAQTPTSQPAASQPAARRIIVLHGGQDSTNAAVDATRQTLARKNFTCIPIAMAASDAESDTQTATDISTQLKDAHADILVAVGPAAAYAAAKSSTLPIVATMIPDALDTPLADPSKTRSTLTIDIAPDRLITQMQLMHTSLQHIAILTSSRSQKTADAIKKAAEHKKINVTLIPANRSSFSAALSALTKSGCDTVLMLPDGQIYNSVNVRELLLWGLRQKHAVWAFSDNLVKAGAFAAVATSPDTIASQTAELVVQRLAKPGQPVPLTYADAFDVSLNHRTAQMIGMAISDDALKTVTRHHGKKQ